MNPTFLTAVAAACGSLLGAVATVVTNWLSLRTQRALAEREAKLRSREALYGEFIAEASRLTIEALGHQLEQPDTFVKLYGLLGRIRLVAADRVLAAAEACVRQLVDLFDKPNMTVQQIRTAFERDRIDPIREFSVVCRRELLDISDRM